MEFLNCSGRMPPFVCLSKVFVNQATNGNHYLVSQQNKNCTKPCWSPTTDLNPPLSLVTHSLIVHRWPVNYKLVVKGGLQEGQYCNCKETPTSLTPVFSLLIWTVYYPDYKEDITWDKLIYDTK